MKNLNQILVVAAVVGAAGVAQAQYSINSVTVEGSTVGPNTGSQSPIVVGSGAGTLGTLANPYYAGSTFPGGTLYGTTTFDVNETASHAVTMNVYANSSIYSSAIGSSPSSDPYFSLTGISGGSGTPIGNDTWFTVVPSTGSQDYLLTVSWTLNNVPANYPNPWLAVFDLNLDAQINSQGHLYDGQTDAYISAVPEPSQAIAGITLLGCGGLVFLGRRFVMKKA